MDYLVAAVALVTVGAYAWSLRGHFVSQTMPRGTQIISAAVTLSALFYLLLTFTIAQPFWAQAIGLALQLAAGWLFIAAISASREARLEYAFTAEKPQTLLKAGPYRHVRHPFYTSYIVFWAGWALATWSVYSVVSLAVMIVLYILAARREEEKFAQTPMAADYEAYKQQAGLFWPKLMGR